jgi:hypothetical protein
MIVINDKGGGVRMMRKYKGYEIFRDDLGRWCVYNPMSKYSRDSDHRVFFSLEQAKEYVDLQIYINSI